MILAIIQEAFPAIQLVGCTTDGELSSEMGFTEDSLILMVFASDTVEISAGAGREVDRRGEAAGREAAEAARAGLKRHAGEEKLAVILADPLNAGVSTVDKGIQGVLGRTFPSLAGHTVCGILLLRRVWPFGRGRTVFIPRHDFCYVAAGGGRGVLVWRYPRGDVGFGEGDSGAGEREPHIEEEGGAVRG